MAGDIANVLWQMFQITEADVINLFFFVHARLMVIAYYCFMWQVLYHMTWCSVLNWLMLLHHIVIYRYKCDRVECDEEYIGESSRTFGERFKEHQKAPSPIFDHHNTTGHNISIENFEIVGREDQNLMRTIKQALYIRVNDPSLNRNIGKYHLPHIWDEVLFNISELKLKN